MTACLENLSWKVLSAKVYIVDLVGPMPVFIR